jgi:hypothetical protein
MGRLAEWGSDFRSPYQHKSNDPDRPGSRRLSSLRYLVETVNGQLAVRYNLKRTWARDLWHLCHRVICVLSHTVMIRVAISHCVSPLSFARLEEV